jgi:hypothetical protein
LTRFSLLCSIYGHCAYFEVNFSKRETLVTVFNQLAQRIDQRRREAPKKKKSEKKSLLDFFRRKPKTVENEEEET